MFLNQGERVALGTAGSDGSGRGESDENLRGAAWSFLAPWLPGEPWPCPLGGCSLSSLEPEMAGSFHPQGAVSGMFAEYTGVPLMKGAPRVQSVIVLSYTTQLKTGACHSAAGRDVSAAFAWEERVPSDWRRCSGQHAAGWPENR